MPVGHHNDGVRRFVGCLDEILVDEYLFAAQFVQHDHVSEFPVIIYRQYSFFLYITLYRKNQRDCHVNHPRQPRRRLFN
jgi:hypothetical protein